jgi:membrane-associated phospholipid phosphatase
MTTLILFTCSILVVTILVFLLRHRLAPYLPRTETICTTILLASIIVLAILALLPDLVTMVSSMKLLSSFFRIVITLVAALVALIGCSKQAEQPKPRKIHWEGPETGYHADSTPDDDKHKESP